MLKKFRLHAGELIDAHKNRISKKLTMCKKCYTFYYKKGWHFEKPSYLEEDREEEISVKFSECPSCMEQKLALFETESNFVLDWR